MSIQYIVLDQGSLVYTCVTETLTNVELLAHEELVLSDATVKPGYSQILDCRRVRDNAIDVSILSALADLHSKHRNQLMGSHYAVVSQSASWFELGSTYPCDRSGMTMIVFNDPNTACIWLGVDYKDGLAYGWFDTRLPATRGGWEVGVSAV